MEERKHSDRPRRKRQYSMIPFVALGIAVVLIVLLIATVMFVTGGTLLGIYVFIKDRVNAARLKQQERIDAAGGDPEAPYSDNFVRKRKKYVPVDIGPEAYGNEPDEMYIDELVGNAEKQDVKPKTKEPKPFIVPPTDTDTKAVEPELPLDEIIKNS